MKQMLILVSIDEDTLKAARKDAGELPEDFNYQSAAVAELGWAEQSGVSVEEVVIADYNKTPGYSHAAKCAAAQKSIAIVWDTSDVQSHCTSNYGVNLTDEQAFEVLQIAERKHDANEGINWIVLDCYIQEFLVNNGLKP